MHRLVVAFLAAFDAAVAAAVGLAAVLAPLTVLFVFGLGGAADWRALWPAGASVWQLGHLVPLEIALPGEFLADAGIDPDAATFVLSLAPLAFTAFTAVFAARSAIRASRADAWATGVLTGSLVFGGIAFAVWTTSGNEVATAAAWQAIVLPAAVFAVPALVAAAVTEWSEAGAGFVARIRDRVEASRDGWAPVPALIARGTGVAVAGLMGLGGIAVTVALVARGAEVIALFQSAHVDALGAAVMTLGQLAYLPTLVVWGIAFIAGPGFALGTGTAVSPAGTQLGVIPGIPVLGAVPETTSTFLLLLALLPVGVGVLAGWVVRSRMLAPRTAAAEPTRVAASDPERDAALAALLATGAPVEVAPASELDEATDAEPIAPRIVVTLGIAVATGAIGALLAWAASGSAGPGRLAEVGPAPGAVALAVGLEVLVGAAILILSPVRAARRPLTGTAARGSAEADG
ncbi:DUF6350 family protein [Microbacterium sp.]|uniref:cell division protein PerM n=1 Tax=Microbacterium sp. TaxID=51671 RepID=UPI002D76CACF|nr:DUF6350 family protein [Microbacterium sp.]HET6302751.1 DUF6350 family protein [Microbacterium sp.]